MISPPTHKGPVTPVSMDLKFHQDILHMEEILHHLGTVSTFRFQRDILVLCHQFQCGSSLISEAYRCTSLNYGNPKWATRAQQHPSRTTNIGGDVVALKQGPEPKDNPNKHRNKSHQPKVPEISFWSTNGLLQELPTPYISSKTPNKCPICFLIPSIPEIPRVLEGL